ncbi:hypothetical protein [Rhizobium sp.]|uniref:hypothetical protein n=1 Tax=Rhizobium sp. TaxID=391 RepID=UPI0028B0133C
MSVIYARERAQIINRGMAGLADLDARSAVTALAQAGAPKPLCVPLIGAAAIEPTRFWNEPVKGPDKRSALRKSKKEKPNNSNKASARGFCIFKDVIVQHESELEHSTSLCIQARIGVTKIYSQYPRLPWADDKGVMHQHTADYFAEFQSGYKIAFVVKNEAKREQMLDLIKRIKAHGLNGIVDDVRLVTETYASRERTENARAILWSRHFHDDLDVQALLNIIGPAETWVRFGDLLSGSNDRRARRIAIWRLIDMGILVSTTGEKITEVTWLRRVTVQ